MGAALSFDLTGCYAEKVKRKASEVLSIPEGVSFAQAATFGVSYSRPTMRYSNVAGHSRRNRLYTWRQRGRLVRRRSSLPSALG